MWLTVNSGEKMLPLRWMLTYNLGCDKICGTKVVLLEELIEKVRKGRKLVNHETI